MALFLCVDCGGSKTSAVVADRDGNIVGRALAGPSNFAYTPAADFQDAVRTAVSAALDATLPAQRGVFASAWFGISGVDSPAAARNAAAAIAPLLNLSRDTDLTVANDTHLLAAPLRFHPDVAHAMTAIAGTGSCVVSFARDEIGVPLELARTGGWGWILGDEGGGFHVGRETLRLMMHDLACSTLGMPPVPQSLLKERILAQFGITGEANAAEVLPIVHIPELHPQNGDVPSYQHIPREKRISQLCPLVFHAAFKEGDTFALRVLRRCAGALADQIAMLCSTQAEDAALKPNGVKPDESVLCFGGSLVGVKEYRELVLDELKKRHCVFRYVEHVDDAAATGAISLAGACPNETFPRVSV